MTDDHRIALSPYERAEGTRCSDGRPAIESLPQCIFADRQDPIIRYNVKEHVTRRKGGPWKLPEAAFHLSKYTQTRI